MKRLAALSVVLLSSALLGTVAVPAWGAPTPSSEWQIQSVPQPTSFAFTHNQECEEREIKCDAYVMTATNIGTRPSEGQVTLKGAIPQGLTISQVVGQIPAVGGGEGVAAECEHTVNEFHCGTVEPVQPGAFITVLVDVLVQGEGQETVTAVAEVNEGMRPAIRTSEPTTVPNTINGPTPLFGFEDFGIQAFDGAGEADVQAGGHPGAIATTIDYTTLKAPFASPLTFLPTEEPKDQIVDLPLGLVGDPLAAGQCPESQLNGDAQEKLCPASSQIGLIAVNYNGTNIPHLFRLYNMTPEPGYPAVFGFHFSEIPVLLRARVLSSAAGYYLSIAVPDIPRAAYLKVTGVSIVIFGNPSEQSGTNSGAQPTAFFTNPSNCSSAPLKARVEMNSWVNPSRWVAREATMYEASPTQGVTGCNHLQFSAAIAVTPETTERDTPSGYEVDLKVPQAPELFGGLATPDLRNASVTLPAGTALSPGAADGLVGCKASGPEGIELGNGNTMSHDVQEGEIEGVDGLPHSAPGHCPAASTLGTVEVKTPLLEQPLYGHIYLGAPSCSPCSSVDAQQGKLIKLYIEAEGSGVIVKIPGTASLNPATGQVTALFKDSPQLPFEELKVQLKSGPRAPLANPPTCGTATTNSTLTPWSAPETPAATSISSFAVSSGPNGAPCAGTEGQLPNKPGFEAGTLTPIAGSYSAFVLKVSREDGTQRISSIDTTLPPGLTGKLAGVPYCSDAQIAAAASHSGNAEKAAPSCPLASDVGTVNVGAGPGSAPFYVQGDAYLAGPYKGAPLSLAIITPAVAGPFDLGNVVVRVALYVNETTAQIHAVSDPIPSILAGVPLDVRSIALQLNRSNFTLNPTSCEAKQITGAAISTLGNIAPLQNRFQVGACAALGFKPKLALRLFGPTHRSAHPKFRAILTARKGDANIGRAAVTLPRTEFLENAHIKTICTRVQYAAHACPAKSIYGYAKAWSPLLDKPLQGPVYLRSSSHELPDLVASLDGQIHIDLDGRIDSVHARIRNTFDAVPDAPVSKFMLTMQGGKKGLLVNNTELCKTTPRADVKFDAQNGKTQDLNPVVKTDCGKKGKSKH